LSEKLQPGKISGKLTAHGLRFAIAVSRFNSFITERLLAAAVDALERSGAKSGDVDVVHVPGAFELPLAAKMFAASGAVEAVVALGCVIRGDTPHFDYVAGECARGLMDAGLATGVPVIFGVLTTETRAQAEERADVGRMNKGGESLEAALEMIQLLAPSPRAPRQRARSSKR